MPKRYLPLLRSKAGEAVALENLAASAKRRLFPIIHVTGSSPPAGFGPRVSAAWAGLPISLDGLHNFGVTNSAQTFTSLFAELGRGRAAVIPSVECNSPQTYVSIVQRLVNRYAPGIVIKCSLRQLAGAAAWATAQGWRTTDADLVVNAGHVADYDPDLFEGLVLHAIGQTLQNPTRWRTVTLASSAAPRDYTALPLGRSDIPRLDWQVWQAVSNSVQFQLDYGDFGTAHPDLTEPPGIAMVRASVSVRYTVDNHWIVLKGHATSGPRGQPMDRQYRAHARVLVGDPQFDQLAGGCWADQRIQQIATQTTRAGNRTTWVSIGVNRHLSFVADRLP